jgi:anthranilate synthase component 1
MAVMPFKDFRKLASQGNLVPVTAQAVADTETPVSAFLKMTQGSYRFLLESMEGGERWGRYSFLGSEPSLVLRSRREDIEILRGKKRERFRGDPLELIRGILSRFHPVQVEGLPRFAGGLVGYLGYDMVRHMERLPDLGKPALPSYDSNLMLQDSVVAFDNLTHQLVVVVMADLSEKDGTRKVYDRALRRIDALLRRLKKPLPALRSARNKIPLNPRSNTSEREFHRMVQKSREYIRAGDIFQVVPSQRWEAKFNRPPFEVYRQLRQVNPSPYLFYLELDGQVLTGSSPEVMVRLEGDKVTLRPIAGTRRRGRDKDDERRMEFEMMHDPKELAEHVMLVDLGRNDVGRVARVGTVRVSEMMTVEKYSHVMHIVSNVEGKLKEGKDAVDVLKACFPAGTLSGAPKIRAMEIIEELEKGKRGPYGGCAGYFDFYGNMDTAITIRSLFFAKGRVWFQAGGGVVLDSKPELEYLESNNKAKAMLEALKRCVSA